MESLNEEAEKVHEMSAEEFVADYEYSEIIHFMVQIASIKNNLKPILKNYGNEKEKDQCVSSINSFLEHFKYYLSGRFESVKEQFEKLGDPLDEDDIWQLNNMFDAMSKFEIKED